MFTLLDRHILAETAKLLVLYSTGFLALISIAVAVPLVRGGAPLFDVLVFLPNQLAFPATLALPLALVTAVLATLARVREDGELTALMAAGVSSLRVVRATLPLVLLVAVLVAWLAHSAMPIAYKNFAAGKASLLRQAMATKVARQEPIFQSSDQFGLEQTTLAALTASGNQLGHVFAWRVGADGRMWMGYAPAARWSLSEAPYEAEPPPELPPEIQAQLGDIELPVDDDQPETTTLLTLDMVDVRYFHHTVDPQELRERTLSREALKALERQQALEAANAAEGALPAPDSGPKAPPYPIIVGGFPRWSASLDKEDVGRADPADAKSTAELAFEIEQLKLYISEFLANIPEGLPPKLADEMVLKTRKRLASHQFAWHLRWMLPAAVLAWWLFAAGLALAVPARNRLTAVAIGLVTIIGTVIPAFATVKGMGGHLPVNPGVLLWSPPLALAVLGLYLAWRRR